MALVLHAGKVCIMLAQSLLSAFLLAWLCFGHIQVEGALPTASPVVHDVARPTDAGNSDIYALNTPPPAPVMQLTASAASISRRQPIEFTSASVPDSPAADSSSQRTADAARNSPVTPAAYATGLHDATKILHIEPVARLTIAFPAMSAAAAAAAAAFPAATPLSPLRSRARATSPPAASLSPRLASAFRSLAGRAAGAREFAGGREDDSRAYTDSRGVSRPYGDSVMIAFDAYGEHFELDLSIEEDLFSPDVLVTVNYPGPGPAPADIKASYSDGLPRLVPTATNTNGNADSVRSSDGEATTSTTMPAPRLTTFVGQFSESISGDGKDDNAHGESKGFASVTLFPDGSIEGVVSKNGEIYHVQRAREHEVTEGAAAADQLEASSLAQDGGGLTVYRMSDLMTVDEDGEPVLGCGAEQPLKGTVTVGTLRHAADGDAGPSYDDDDDDDEDDDDLSLEDELLVYQYLELEFGSNNADNAANRNRLPGADQNDKV